MKKLLLAAFLFVSVLANAQTATSSVFCVQVNCPITIQLPIDSVQIFGQATIPGDTVTSYQWKVVSGPSSTISTPTAVTSWAKALNTPGVYLYSLTATTKHGNVMTNAASQVTVLAATAAPTPPVVTGVTITLFGQTFTIPTGQGTVVSFLYNGVTQTVKF